VQGQSLELLQTCTLIFSNETLVGWLLGATETLSSSATEEKDRKIESGCFGALTPYPTGSFSALAFLHRFVSLAETLIIAKKINSTLQTV